MENFRVPKTPESRTPYVLALLAIIGLLGAAVRLFVGSRYSIEMLLMLAAAAGSYAICATCDNHRAEKKPNPCVKLASHLSHQLIAPIRCHLAPTLKPPCTDPDPLRTDRKVRLHLRGGVEFAILRGNDSC